MAKVLVVYYSSTGNTAKMAEAVAEGVRKETVEVEVKKVAQTKAEDLLEPKGIIIGSPTYYGGPAAEIKKLLDESIRFHGKLEGKIGGAFTSSANIGGGNETTIMDIIKAFLIHGMIVQGTSKGDHYGPVAIGSPDRRAIAECKLLGERVAKLVKRLLGERK